MPLLAIWETNPNAVGEFSIEQVVATAGDGVLRDGSLCSREFVTYLSQASSNKLAEYVQYCLTTKFDRSGMALQDVVNELGRRLDYDVTNGRYQGTVNTVGFDGLWKGPEGQTIISEVKTTDAYRISLDTIMEYRRKLALAGTIDGECSVLIVVGREDTGELEAQVRGSRHAWDIRIVSAESLIKLVRLKENSDDPETGRKIRSVLQPVEYTRLDRLVDAMFTTATDVQPALVEPEDEDTDGASTAEILPSTPAPRGPSGWEFTDPVSLSAKRDEIIGTLSKRFGTPLIKNTRALYWSADHRHRVACTISKRYRQKFIPYWYAYHPSWDDFLSSDSPQESYLALGCMDLRFAFVLPREVVLQLLPDLNTTESERAKYWHIHIAEITSAKYELVVPHKPYMPLDPYRIELAEQTNSGTVLPS